MTDIQNAFLTIAASRLNMSKDQVLATACEWIELFSRADRVVVTVDGVEKTILEKKAPE